MDEKFIKLKLHNLEDRIARLETRRGGRIGEMALWIKDRVSSNGYITIRRLKADADKLGYSWQMLQRVRREILGAEIDVKFSEPYGWVWKKRQFRIATSGRRTQETGQDFAKL